MPAKPANATMRVAPAQDTPRTGAAAVHVHGLRSAQHDSRCCGSSQRRRIVVSRQSWPGVLYNPEYTNPHLLRHWNRLCTGLYHRPVADCRRPQRRHLRRLRLDVERQVATTARLFLCRWCILCRYIKCVCMCEAANTGLLVALAGSAGLKPCKQKTWWMKRPNSLTDEVEAHDPCYDARHAGKY